MESDAGIGLTCTLEMGDSGRLLRLNGDLGIASAGPVRTALLEGLQAADNVTLDVHGLTALDVSGLQLLCSAHRSFRAQRLAFRMDGLPQHLRELAREAGFDSRCSECRYRDDTCLWRN